MEYKNTINNILKRLEKDFEIVRKDDIAETFETLFLTKDFSNKILVEDREISIPLAASKETKKMLLDEKSPILKIYKDFERGDILLVKEAEDNKLLVENLSIKEEYRKDFYIEKVDILTKKFNVVKRKTINLINVLESLTKS